MTTPLYPVNASAFGKRIFHLLGMNLISTPFDVHIKDGSIVESGGDSVITVTNHDQYKLLINGQIEGLNEH